MENKKEPLRIAEKGGTITIGQAVVTAIAEHAAARTLAAAGTVASGPRGETPAKRRLEQVKRVRVSVAEDESRPLISMIDLAVTLHEGEPIPTVAAAVQRSVKETVENMTGFSVSRVNLEVRDIIAAKRLERSRTAGGKGAGKETPKRKP